MFKQTNKSRVNSSLHNPRAKHAAQCQQKPYKMPVAACLVPAAQSPRSPAKGAWAKGATLACRLPPGADAQPRVVNSMGAL